MSRSIRAKRFISRDESFTCIQLRIKKSQRTTGSYK